MKLRARRACVVGGSIGGLTAALLLRDAGWDVDVFERSAGLLEGRGGGIVAHPATIRYLVERAGLAVPEISASASWFRYLDAGGGIAHEEACRYRFTSYDALYRRLLDAFGRDRYHLGEECVGLRDAAGGPRPVLASGREVQGELVVFADGINSVGRRLLSPDARPVYAGYVAWRGSVTEHELGPAAFDALASAITYHVCDDGHTIGYPIPARGPRLLNWLWYRNVPDAEVGSLTGAAGGRFPTSVPPGLVPAEHSAELRRRAREELPPVMADVVQRTPAPYVQVIVDVEVERMAAERACLIGDGAFAARPHIAVGTAKAAEDAWTLAAALDGSADDLDDALASWSDRQVALGTSVVARAREAGTRLQTGRWRVGEPLPYGLYWVGDSSIADTP